jgi:UrcA family protein
MKLRTFALAVAAATVVAVPAAAEVADKNVAAVQYRDLDLATDAGREELERRLDKAARDVCGMSDVVTGSRIRSREARQCYAQARSQMTEQFALLVERQGSGG